MLLTSFSGPCGPRASAWGDAGAREAAERCKDIRTRRTGLLHGFTLIELLVVVTIIVVLLALLTPALDKAIYRAELTTCAARLKGLGTGALTYAIGNRRLYPDRTNLTSTNWKWPSLIADTDSAYDLRPLLEGYTPLDMLMCPLSPKVSFSPADTGGSNPSPPWVIFSSYAIWFGFSFEGYPGMKRVGNRLAWSNDAGKTFDYFQVLAADWEMLYVGQSYGAHPDHDGIMAPFATQAGLSIWGERHTITRWQNPAVLRNTADRSFGFTDGSVRTIDRVLPQEPRLTPIGLAASSTTATLAAGQEQLPAEGQ